MKTNQRPSIQSPLPVAIIGMGCLYPGSPGLKAYWRLLTQGIDAITEVPASHWCAADYFDTDPKRPDYVCCKRGGFLDPVDFDPSEFGIPPTSLEATDSSQLLGLITAKMALADAGYDGGRPFDRDRTSVVLGVTGTQELVLPLSARLGHPKWRKALDEAGVPADQAREVIAKISDSYVPWQENSFPGLLGNVVAGRICNRLDLGGTNCVVDAACASSLSAVHLALMELYTGRSDMVITGGVDTLNDIFMHMCFARTHVLSPTGDARPFSKNADGTVLGEGIGMLVLKRLADAQRDRDRVYAVIRALGSASDGKSNSIYAPRPEGQAKALRKAYELADVAPESVDLMEAHGTGTRVGDAMEFKALCQVFGNGAKNGNRCALGTVKSMIGHTKAAAGAAGLIKSALALYHQVLPPTLKAQDPDPSLNIADSPFYLNTKRRPWLARPDSPRRCGVSAFGFGGSNFHVVLEEYPSRRLEPAWDGSVDMIAFSAKNRLLLLRQVQDFRAQIETGDGSVLTQKVAATRAAFQSTDPHRILGTLSLENDRRDYGKQLAAWIEKASAFLSGDAVKAPDTLFYGAGDRPGKLGLVFPGQGSQYVDMGKDLACTFPEFTDALTAGNQAFGAISRLSDRIYPLPEHPASIAGILEDTLRRTDVAQPAIGAVSLGMLKVLQRFGITADAAAGHSYGELTALRAAGCLDTETFLRLSVDRGHFMAEAGKQAIGDAGTMTAVMAPLETTENLIQSHGLAVVLANRNSPEQGVLSGAVSEIQRAEAICREKGLKTVRLSVAAAFHSPLVKDAQGPFGDCLAKATFHRAKSAVFSNTTGLPYPDDPEAAKNLLAEQITHPVAFVDEIRAMVESGVKTFVEVGPRSVLCGMVRATISDNTVQVMAMDASGGRRSGLMDLASTLCRLAAIGFPVRLSQWESAEKPSRTPKMKIPISGANYRGATALRPPPSGGPKPHEGVARFAPPEVAAMPESVHQVTIPVLPPHNLSAKSAVISRNIAAESFSPMKNSMSARNNAAQAALQAVQEGLKSMQRLQAQTTQAHQKFLEVQSEAGRTLQAMMEHTRHLAAAAMGLNISQTASTAKPGAAKIQSTVEPGQAPVVSTANPSIDADPAVTAKPGQSLAEPDSPDRQAVKSVKRPDAAAKNDISETLFYVVSQLTGYPQKMLNREMDIEADLGIDSIKRVEILSAMEERMPDIPTVSPDVMASLKTLGQIADYLQADARTLVETDAQPKQAISGDVPATLLSVVSQLTGYPVEMLTLDMDIEADLGIDSIKRVEILSAMEERLPNMPPVSPETMANLKTLGQIVSSLTRDLPEITRETMPGDAGSPPVAETGSGNGITATLLSVVGQLTGYPEEMLTLDMDIEADLGIDSIKRVEILSAMEERMPSMPPVSPETMANLKTLGQIAGCLSGKTAPTTADPSLPKPSSSEPPGAMPSPEAKTGVKRQVITVTEAPGGGPAALPRQGRVRVWGDGALAHELCQALKRRGVACRKASAVSELEDIDGLILVADSMTSASQATADLTSAFAAAKTAGPALMAAAKSRGAFFTTVTRIDGCFGFLGSGIENPYAGALAALAKTAALEWENVVCRAIDLDPTWDLSAAVAAAAEEILTGARGPVEVGLSPNHRRVLTLVPAQAAAGTLALSQKDVVVITGGARGVTACAAIALAEASGAALALLGRSPAPEPEPAYLVGLTDEGALKRAILKHLPPDKATPADIAQVYRRVVANREIGDTLNRLSAMKVRSGYYPVDVRDASALSEVLDTIRSQMGAIGGIIHGAGVLEDRRIVDKTMEQFHRVFSTKVQGLENLLRLTAEDPLSYIVLFSSVSARFGNIGQADYAMANEVLNKVARREALARPHCRVVSINWGPWNGGMVSAPLKREFSRKGIDLIPMQAGARAMVTEMAQPAGAAVEVVLGAGLIPDPPAEAARFSESAGLNLALKREIDVNRLPVLDAHRLDGIPVIPFALITEWLGNGALHENPGLFFQGMDDIRLLKGIQIGKDPKLIRLMAGKARKKGALYEVDVEIRNGVQQGRDVIHSRARAILGLAPAAAPAFSIPVIANGTPYPRTVKEAYEKVLFHGHPLHGILKITGYSEKGLEAKIASAPAPAVWMREPLRSRWIGDPLVLDSAFQMAILWCYEKKGSVCLPSYASAYRQYCRQFPESGVTAVLQVTDAGPKKITGDFTFLNADGQVLATLNGYEAVMDPALITAFKTNATP